MRNDQLYAQLMLRIQPLLQFSDVFQAGARESVSRKRYAGDLSYSGECLDITPKLQIRAGEGISLAAKRSSRLGKLETYLTKIAGISDYRDCHCWLIL